MNLQGNIQLQGNLPSCKRVLLEAGRNLRLLLKKVVGSSREGPSLCGGQSIKLYGRGLKQEIDRNKKTPACWRGAARARIFSACERPGRGEAGLAVSQFTDGSKGSGCGVMDTTWTITEFDLTKLVFWRRASLREIATGTAVVIAAGIVVVPPVFFREYWYDWFGWAGPWLAGLVFLACAALVVMAMIERAKERIGIQATADVTDRYSLDDILADQPDRIGQVAGVSARDVLQATSTMLSGPSSEQATPPERRPDRRIVSGLSRIILWILIVIVALVSIAFTIYMANPSSPNPVRIFKLIFGAPAELIVGGPAAMIAFLLFLLARTRKKSADHLLEYDQRPPILFLRSFKDDDRKIWMARQGGDRSLVGFEDALSEIFFRIGPFIALGSGQDLIPQLGAARTYRDDTVWQAKAKHWMKDATWILYMLGSTESLKWEIAQITLDKLVGKTIFLFPPNVREDDFPWVTKARLKKRRLRNWNHFLQTFANTEFHDALGGFDESGAIVMWIGPGRHIFVVRGRGEFSQEYDLALRIAIYLKTQAGVGSSQISAGSVASSPGPELSPPAGDASVGADSRLLGAPL